MSNVLRLCILAITVLINSQVIQAASIDLPKNYLKVFNASKKDIKNAKALDEVLRDLNKGKIKSYNINLLAKNINKKSPYYEILPLIRGLKNVSKTKRLATINKHCPYELKKESTSFLYNHLALKVNRYCRERFLRLSINKLPSNKDLDQYFEHSLVFLLRGEAGWPFRKLLNILKKKKKDYHQKISTLATAQIIDNEISPPVKLLEYLTISPKLTTYIQEKGLFDRQSRRYFTNEFKKIRREFYRSINSGKIDEALKYVNHMLSFYSQNSPYISHERAFKTFISSGKKFLLANQAHDAMILFDFSLQIAANDEEVNESLFYMVWGYYLNGQTNDALKLIKEHKLLSQFEKMDQRLRFWVAKVVMSSGDYPLAKSLYTKIISDSPLSFYSIISLREISHKSSPQEARGLLEKLTSTQDTKIIPTKYFTRDYINMMKRILLWIEVKNDRVCQKEINALLKSDPSLLFSKKSKVDPFVAKQYSRVLLGKVLTDSNNFLKTFKVVYKSLDSNVFELNKSTLNLLFPEFLLPTIKKADATVDPIVVLSLIRQESAFNPYARSIVGARGLMQLMPATAKDLDRKVNVKDLYKPEKNVKLGIKLLKRLFKKYDGNLVYTLSAYNAGEGAVRRWQNLVFFSEDPLITIESIPYQETRQYVKLIYRNMFFYKLLNDNLDMSTPISSSFKIAFKNSQTLKRK